MPENQVEQNALNREDVVAIVGEVLQKHKLIPSDEVVVPPSPSEKGDLLITDVKYDKGELSIFIYSRLARINPYLVKITEAETGKTIRLPKEVPHSDPDAPLRMQVLLSVGKAVIVAVQSVPQPELFDAFTFTRLQDKTEEDKTEEEDTDKDEDGTDVNPDVPTEKEGFIYPIFGMNTTGYGFNETLDAIDNLPDEWWKRLEYAKKKGIVDFARIYVDWQNWEPTKGVFSEVDLLRVSKRLRKMGVGMALCVRPYRSDNRIAINERATDQNGKVFVEGPDLPGVGLHTFSIGAVNAQAEFKTAMVALAKFCAMHEPNAVYVSMGYGYTEEFNLPIIYADSGTKDERAVGICTYSQADRNLFQSVYGFPLPSPQADNLPWSMGDLYRDHHQVLDFITSRLASIYNDFVDTFHDHCKVPVCGYYPDVVTEQSAWYGHRDLVAIFGRCDMIYSTEGTYPDDPRKLLAADLHQGTFPHMVSIIEMDPTDEGAEGGEISKPIDPASVQRTLSRAIERGVRIVTWAMAHGEGHMDALAPMVSVLRQGVKVAPPSKGITVDISSTLYSGKSLYVPAWEAAGGKDKPTPVHSVKADPRA